MITNIVDYLSQAYTRILHERRKVQHLVQLNQHLLTRVSPQEDAVRFPSPECKASKSLICSTSPTSIPSMLCFFHMTTGGIDESLPRPSPSRFGSSDHALVCLPDADPMERIAVSVSRHLNPLIEWPTCGLDPWRPVGDHRCPQMASSVFRA